MAVFPSLCIVLVTSNDRLCFDLLSFSQKFFVARPRFTAGVFFLAPAAHFSGFKMGCQKKLVNFC